MNNLRTDENDPKQMFRLDGRVAFLSGASGWLGRPMARALASAGAHVILNGRTKDTLEDCASELRQMGLNASIACFDVTDEVLVRQHVDQIEQQHGRLDILVNNASSGRPGTIETATVADFDQLYRVNVTAAFQILQHSLPLLKRASDEANGASVINIASMYGYVSPDPSIYGTSRMNNPPYYGAAKAALIQLTRYAACHLAGERIRVNCISPGPFPAPRVVAGNPDFHAHLEAKNPMHRIGRPAELMGPLLFLASDASSYVTGVNLAVDGGWTAW